MTADKTRAALGAMRDLLTALETTAQWNAGPLRGRVADAEAELDQIEAGATVDAPPDAGPEPGDDDVLALLEGLEEPGEVAGLPVELL